MRTPRRGRRRSAGPRTESIRDAAAPRLVAPTAVHSVGDHPAHRVAPGGAARLYVDGGSRGNPGKSAIGVVLQDERGELLAEIGRTIGISDQQRGRVPSTAHRPGIGPGPRIEQLQVFSDSELLVKQILGQYRVKNEGLQPLYEEAKERLKDFPALHHQARPQREERARRQTRQPGIGRSGRESARVVASGPRFA